MFDLQQFTVLKGPQALFFGKLARRRDPSVGNPTPNWEITGPPA